jgi:hypothetical protein
VGVEKSNIIGSQPSVEEGMAEMLNIHMCLTSRIFERAGCWRNQVLCGNFKTFVNCSFHASAKKTSMSQNRNFNNNLRSSGGAKLIGRTGNNSAYLPPARRLALQQIRPKPHPVRFFAFLNTYVSARFQFDV